MPRVFQAINIPEDEKEVRKDYFDRHMPHVICEDKAKAGEKFRVKVVLGDEYPHPDETNHYISYIQLWNRETFIAEAHFTPGILGNKPGHLEVDFFIVPGPVSMNLSAMAVCTNHGLWQSEAKEVKII
ncbi:MAG: desulfoferrodoxin family protein [Bacteroidales bacterium]|jgi:superoxide reductase|nr:desulfoferrodoxin family protein [Bacteroidales bacterium]